MVKMPSCTTFTEAESRSTMTLARLKRLIIPNCYWLLIFCVLAALTTPLMTPEAKRPLNSTEVMRDKRSLTGLGLFQNREKTRPSGQYFPIALYSVKHHRPGNRPAARRVRPEVWEYRGQYFYGFRKRQREKQATRRLLAASLPLLLAPLLSLVFTLPVIIPVAMQPLMQPLMPAALNAGRRKRASKMIPDSKAEEIRSVAHYLHKVNYDEFQQGRLVASYLQCNGLLDSENHCMERLSCEFADPRNSDAPELEKTVTSILLGHILKNTFIPQAFKNRLKAAAVYGTRNQGQCDRFICLRSDDENEEKFTLPS